MYTCSTPGHANKCDRKVFADLSTFAFVFRRNRKNGGVGDVYIWPCFAFSGKIESRTTSERMGVLERQLAEASRAQAEALKTEAHLKAELKRVEAAAVAEAARLRQENAETLAALQQRVEVAAEPAERKALEVFSADVVQRLERELAVRDKQATEQVCTHRVAGAAVHAAFFKNEKKKTSPNPPPNTRTNGRRSS